MAVVAVHGQRPGVGITADGKQAVEETGILIADAVLLDGAARAARTDGVPDRSVRFGQMLLDHHQGFGVQLRVGIGSMVGHDGRCGRESARQRIVVEGVVEGALGVLETGAGAEQVQQLAVPGRLRRPGGP